MLFNSVEFLFFLLVTVAVFALSPRMFRRHILLAASLYFYASWSVSYLFLLLFVIVTSYAAGLLIIRRGRREACIAMAAITCPLAVLGVFKYGNFVIDNVNVLFAGFGSGLAFDGLELLLPVGISFYTFQAIAYVVDVKAGRVESERSLIDYALYISFFPQLVAGPIERPGNILPQIKRNLLADGGNISLGVSLILQGFFKKLVIADRLGRYVDKVYLDIGGHSPEQLVVAMYYFAFQIYCDFSGYTDIARGVARLFNVELMVNFDRPYLARSLQEFWRRWHISLSTWFRDYLYIPLGGSRKGLSRTLLHIMVVFGLCGLWHGAAYTFVVWGALHGVFLCIEQGYRKAFPAKGGRNALLGLVQVIVTFHLTCLLWVFFRAETIGDAFGFMGLMFRSPSLEGVLQVALFDYQNFLGTVCIVLLMAFEVMPIGRARHAPAVRCCVWRYAASVALLCAVLALGMFESAPFIYFQF